MRPTISAWFLISFKRTRPSGTRLNSPVLFSFAQLLCCCTSLTHAQAADEWARTGSLAAARRGHSATLLNNGMVLVAGGMATSGEFLSSCELYDASTGEWTTTGSLAVPRLRHAATLLGTGEVLVSGGYGESDRLSSCELFDPAAGTWSTVSSLTYTHDTHTATLLNSGKVLVVGGDYDSAGGATMPCPFCELYDPTTTTWTLVASLNTARLQHTATLLVSTGEVLVAGGQGGGTLGSCERYDPVGNAWNTTGPMSTSRHSHTATALTNLDFHGAQIR